MTIEYNNILKPHFCLVIIIIIISLAFNKNVTASIEEEATTTPEPGPAPGCRAPDIRFTVVKPETATEQPFAKFETTPGDDLSLGDGDIADKINIDLSGRSTHQMGGGVNPYQVDIVTGSADEQMMAIEGDLDYSMDAQVFNQKRLKPNRRGKKRRRITSPRKRRLENENSQNHERSKRQVIRHDPDASPYTDRWDGSKLAAEGDVYYVYIDDILKSSSLSNELRAKLHKLKKLRKKTKCPQKTEKGHCKKRHKEKINSVVRFNETPYYDRNMTERQVIGEIPIPQEDESPKKFDTDQVLDKGMVKFISSVLGMGNRQNNLENDTVIMIINKDTDLRADVVVIETYGNSTDELLQRVKRKSGKTAGALGRSKGGGESSSKTTSRKDKGVLDEEGGYAPVHPDETDDDEEEEEEEIDIQQQFTEVSEIRFPGEIGPLGDRRLCKISCIKGKWAGPLCATNEEDNNGNVKFQPLYKSCHVNRIPPHLLLSYRNISVTLIPSSKGFHRNRTSRPVFVSHTKISVGWDLPHGHSFQARCKELGLYKLLGEPRVVCSDGMWYPRMPSCVPTSLLTNFSEDSAPSIRYQIKIGSAAFEPSGVLAILPGSTIILDCIYPRVKGNPEWTWSIWFVQYPTGWSNAPDEKNLRYRLTIKHINRGDTGTFTCTSPRGLTNSVTIIVANSTCLRLSQPIPPLTLRLEGNKLGQKALYRCPPGFRVEGEMNSTCLASGNWSSPPPTCQAVQCPRLTFDDPHLSLVELNTSAFGRAVFKCQWGFKLTGPTGLECKPYGEWNGPVPRCQEIVCPLPIPPLNGRISGSNISRRRLTVGALITFSCNEGHSLVGEPSIICTETGYWSHPPPFCKSQCAYPGDPLNGLIAPLKFNYDSGDYLSVQCRPGFVQYSEKGPPERPICQPDGSWSAPVPKCRSYEEV